MRFNRVFRRKTIIVALVALIAGCDPNEPPQQRKPPDAAEERISAALRSLEQARTKLEKFPRLDLFVKTTREFVILRQVELSDEPLDWKTRKDLADARSRAEAVLPEIAKFAPMIRQLEEAFFDLRGSLHHVASSIDLHPESRATIGLCRSEIRSLLDDLNLAHKVLTAPDSVFPNSEYYDPDFTGTLLKVETALRQARKR